MTQTNKLESFLTERHDLTQKTKNGYRLALKALGKYTSHPLNLNRVEMNESLEHLAQDYKPASWNAYVNCIRSFYKWAYGKDEEYPEAVRKIRLKKLNRADYIKTKILSEDETKALIVACGNPRDRAFLAVAAATGARKGELLNLKIRDVVWKPYGYDLVVTGKTGTHPSPPIVKEYAKILRVWLEHHPYRDNLESPLWVRLHSGCWGSRKEGINRVQAHNIIKNAAKNAGITRNIHLHMMRHTENTLETKSHVPAAARKKLHGWSDMSNVPAIYEHLTDEESVNEVLKGHGLAEAESDKPYGELVKCGYCGTENAGVSMYCTFCGVLLSEEEVAKVKAKEAELQGLGLKVKKLESQLSNMAAEEYMRKTKPPRELEEAMEANNDKEVMRMLAEDNEKLKQFIKKKFGEADQ